LTTFYTTCASTMTKGQPIDYEILVDGFKAVRRTSDPDMFTMFENFVTADTRSIEILLFTGSSNNNEKRIFYFGEDQKEGLSGVDVKTSWMRKCNESFVKKNTMRSGTKTKT
jgi:hypothetical protein